MRSRLAWSLRREHRWLVLAVLLGVGVRVAAVLLMRHQGLAGDELEYDADGRLFAAGHPFWSITPYGIPHPSAWKAPGYSVWVGSMYTLLGPHHVRVELVQALTCGPATILLTHRLAGRLYGGRVAGAAALLVALYPLAWQYEILLLSESLATPLTLGVLLLAVERRPSRRLALQVGALLGLLVLVRPTSICLLVGLAVGWALSSLGVRGGLRLAGLASVAALVLIAPWTIRNAVVLGAFEPISGQDAAVAGTFNATAAADPVWPYAWRPVNPRDAALFDPRHRLSEAKLTSTLVSRGLAYMAAHPLSLPAAFFWNGLSRLWDVRRPSRALAEVRPEARSRFLTVVGLAMYAVLAPLALLALWRMRAARRPLVWALMATGLAASVVFTIDAGTRYRAPFEPVIATLAVSVVAAGLTRRRPGAARPTSLPPLPAS